MTPPIASVLHDQRGSFSAAEGVQVALFPLAVERLAGIEAGALLGATGVDEVDVAPVAAADRVAACTAIEQAIRAAFDGGGDADARCLLAFKRRLYNSRAAADDAAVDLLPPAVRTAVETVVAADRAVAMQEARRTAVLDARAAAMDERLDRFGAAAETHAAIAFSGAERPRLLRATRSGSRPVKPGERRRSRLALLQFAARAACKTTPFSYFGATALVAAGAGGPGDAPPAHLRAQLALDAAAVQRLVWTVILHCATLRDSLVVRLNPGLVCDGAAFSWTAAPIDLSARESWGGAPSAIRVPASAALVALLDAVAAQPGAALGGLPGGADLGRQALAARLVEPVGMPGAQQPLLGWLGDRIASSAVPVTLGDAVATLAALEFVTLDAPATDVAARLAAARTAICDLYAALGLAAPAERRPPLYHAAVDVAPRVVASAVALDDLAPDLAALTDLARLCSRSLAQQSRLADAFVADHGADAMVDATAFFARHAGRGQVADDADAAAFEQLLRAHRRDEDGVMRLSPERIGASVAMLSAGEQARRVALGVQGQWIARDGAPAFVLNRTFPGGLRLTARYLRDDVDQSALAKAHLEREHGDATLAALPATFGINGALHPRLLDHEIALPGVERDRDDAQPIALDALSARYDERQHRVVLVDHAGCTVAPVLLGAVNPWLLPPVVRLLAENGAASALPIYATLWRAADVAADRPDRAALAMIPEVRIGRLVIARETMVYPSTALPTDPDARGFQRAMLGWLEARGLPARVFVRFPAGPLLARLLRDTVAHGAAERRHVKAKPAFYDFAEPGFAELFQQVLRAQPPLISLQACAPDPVAGRVLRELQFEIVGGGRT